MKALTVIVVSFAVFAYDLSYNDGQIVRGVASLLGLN
jgi:hypothetical protein